MTLDLTDEEKLALAAELKRIIEADHYPLSPRILTLRAILAKLDPPLPSSLRSFREQSWEIGRGQRWPP
jgi:hypothetical protein